MSLSSLLLGLNRAKPWRRRVRVWGHTFKATSLDRLVCLLLHRCGLMGKEDRRLLRRLVRPGMEVVDIGANLGLYSLLFAELTGPTGRVHAFEPEPTLFKALQRNLQRNGAANVRAVNLALGNCPGRVAFYRSLFNSGDNRLGDMAWKGQRLEVEQVRLDDALPNRRVDFVKMDVQGYELKVLEGMDGVLEASPEVSIYFEFCPADLQAAGTPPEAILEHLQQRGFRVWHIDKGVFREVRGMAGLAGRVKGRQYTNLLASRNRG
jgi:FkbM family methyltransferase